MDLIKIELDKTKDALKKFGYGDITDERAFIYLILRFFYFNGNKIDNIHKDLFDMITDGANDGGVDFVYYEEENNKVIIGQSKYSITLDNNEIITELNKMSNTVENFLNASTGEYNANVKRELQNALDRLPDEDLGNVEYVLYTTANVNLDSLKAKIENENSRYSYEMVTVFQTDDIIRQIESVFESALTINEASIKIDKAKNYLQYENEKTLGLMVNLSSVSLTSIYNAYAEKGLFDLNIRKYIRNKMVDDGIKKTLDNDRENFWFLNNGLIIACESFFIDGNKINLYGFSIVNGGQTTNLIGNYKGSNKQEFFIPCKIVAEKIERKNMDFFTKIA